MQQIYQHLDSLEQEYKIEQIAMKSPLMNYLVELSKNNKNVPPKSMGYVHKRNADAIDLTDNKISEDYIIPFVKSLGISNKLKILNLTNTNISKYMAE